MQIVSLHENQSLFSEKKENITNFLTYDMWKFSFESVYYQNLEMFWTIWLSRAVLALKEVPESETP